MHHRAPHPSHGQARSSSAHAPQGAAGAPPAASPPGHPRPRTDTTVLLLGGNGGMSDRYREVVEEKGLVLRHYEKKVPPGVRHTLGRVAAVVIMVGMVSHALRDQVKGLVTDGAPVVYLRTASVSALRAAVENLEA
jgi:hypothetical protein